MQRRSSGMHNLMAQRVVTWGSKVAACQRVAEVGELRWWRSSDIAGFATPIPVTDMPVVYTSHRGPVDQELVADALEVAECSHSSLFQGDWTCCPCYNAARLWAAERACVVHWER